MTSNPSVSFRFFGHHLSMRLAWLTALVVAVVFVIVRLAPEQAETGDTILWYVRATLLTAGATLSVLVHELAHATVANRIGAATTGVRLYPLGAINQGFSHPPTPGAEASIAIAGPLTSGAIGGLLYLVAIVLPAGVGQMADTVGLLAFGNLLFAGINLLPGFPLDGGRILRALIWYLHNNYAAGTRVAVAYGQFIGTIGLASGLVLLGGQSDWSAVGALIVTMSWGVNRAGREEVIRSFLTEKGASLPAREMVVGLNPHVRSEQALDEILELLLAEMHSGPALVSLGTEPVGVLGLEQVRRFPRSQWHTRAAAEAMIPLDCLPRIDGSLTLRELLEEVASAESNLLVVHEGGAVIGVLDRRLAIQRLFGRSKAQDKELPRRPPV